MDPIAALLEQLRNLGSNDPALKQRITGVCRSVLAVLEPTGDGQPIPVPPDPAAGASDPLGVVLEGIIERYGPMLPEKLPPIPALSIPFVDYPGQR
jgi:hypothetical protein